MIIPTAAIILVLPLMLASDLPVGLVVLILKILMKPSMLFRRQALIVSILMDLVELFVYVIMLSVQFIVRMLMLMQANDPLVGLVVLILQVFMKAGVFFGAQPLFVRILMDLIELIMHASMLVVELLVLRAVVSWRMSKSWNCKCNYRSGNDRRHQ